MEVMTSYKPCRWNSSLSAPRYKTQYSQATSEPESMLALKQIEVTSQKLAQCAVLCVRLAIEIGLFDNLPPSAPFTLHDLIQSVGTDPEFTGRIVRALATLNIFEEVDDGTFRQTALSQEWGNKFMQSYTRYLWDSVIRAMSQYDDFFNTISFVSPYDLMSSPYTFSKGVRNIDSFSLVQQDPKAAKTLNEAMTKDEVLLVDIGGGKGQSIQSIISTYPDIKGWFILQDLRAVSAMGEVVCPSGVDAQPYNFFKQVQPIRGAAAYLLKLALDNWSEAECRTILRNLAPAMRGYNSKLLICEIVLTDSQPDLQKVLYDINMSFVAGKERSLKQWCSLRGYWVPN
ncbi:O-methyltransferase-domain-containing protein [Aspergillus novoparasiticus]|uniref:O-methyltransferase-domain-containing protein n=1 Tax=Aspergillus novoparasiticus TaxID=986946 RepID=A0A5N6EYF2_9EURO|nr:O-methyltransferase-domain-containing protein [Aspergillus novoparasiticus]